MSVRWLVVLVACTPPPQAAPPLTGIPPVVPCPPTGDAVEPNDDIRITAPAHAELACQPGRTHCVTHVDVTIRNCRPDPLIAGGPGRYFDRDSPNVMSEADAAQLQLAPGASWTFGATIGGEGDARVSIHVETIEYRTSIVDTHGTSHIDRAHPTRMIFDASSPPIHVTNPQREADIAACKQCNGDWGHHGMMWRIDPSPGADPGDNCRCRTTDKGKHCEDGDDCQGWCELERFVVAGKLRYPVGTCSEFGSVQSCATQIPWGARARRGHTIETQQICVD